mmetsp:Transcript_19029/g.51583  ORF Transcript_19029/g.51583 Transcript_19029/m.51583 type:complete len:239 (+) Transcript_19029:206-922(+)
MAARSQRARKSQRAPRIRRHRIRARGVRPPGHPVRRHARAAARSRDHHLGPAATRWACGRSAWPWQASRARSSRASRPGPPPSRYPRCHPPHPPVAHALRCPCRPARCRLWYYSPSCSCPSTSWQRAPASRRYAWPSAGQGGWGRPSWTMRWTTRAAWRRRGYWRQRWWTSHVACRRLCCRQWWRRRRRHRRWWRTHGAARTGQWWTSFRCARRRRWWRRAAPWAEGARGEATRRARS